MSLNRRDKIVLACFPVVIAFAWMGSHLYNFPAQFIRDVNKGYRGIILNKFQQHGIHLTILTTGQETLDVAPLSGSLILQSAIGDSIEKIPGDDYVILNKNGVKRKVLYLYIPDYIRNDRRWPREWKDRWYDEDQQKE